MPPPPPPTTTIPTASRKQQQIAVLSMILLAVAGIASIRMVRPPSTDACDESTTVFRSKHSDDDDDSTKTTRTSIDILSSSSSSNSQQHIFDFAIVGFPKTATTFLHSYFRKNVPQIYIPRKELCDLFEYNTTVADIVSRFYDPYDVCNKDKDCLMSKDSRHNSITLLDHLTKLYENKVREISSAQLTGFKCPRVLETEHTYPAVYQFFKETNFIVQIRHPVLWFESYYNYRSKERYPERLKDPNDLVGACDFRNDPYVVKAGLERVRNVCTDRSKFHVPLARLGLTPMNTQEELELLGDNLMSVVPSSGKVFLLELGQLNLDNDTRTDAFRTDLQRFLGLQLDSRQQQLLLLPPFGKHSKQSDDKSGSKAHTINICDKEHKKAHDTLLANGRNAATWIREYFLRSDRVQVTSKEYFLELLSKWDEDPCLSRRPKEEV